MRTRMAANALGQAVVDRQVRLVDVAPTILALTGTPPPADFGLDASLAPYAGRDVLTPSSPDVALPAFASLQPQGQEAVRHPDQKLIAAPFEPVAEQLFDLATDPAERTNVVATRPDEATRLRAELAAWRETAARAATRAEAAAMSEDHKAALRALGYIE
jgi:arylsulfatase A-like enzyme